MIKGKLPDLKNLDEKPKFKMPSLDDLDNFEEEVELSDEDFGNDVSEEDFEDEDMESDIEENKRLNKLYEEKTMARQRYEEDTEDDDESPQEYIQETSFAPPQRSGKINQPQKPTKEKKRKNISKKMKSPTKNTIIKIVIGILTTLVIISGLLFAKSFFLDKKETQTEEQKETPKVNVKIEERVTEEGIYADVSSDALTSGYVQLLFEVGDRYLLYCQSNEETIDESVKEVGIPCYNPEFDESGITNYKLIEKRYVETP